jgi:uncharacterized membrane protein
LISLVYFAEIPMSEQSEDDAPIAASKRHDAAGEFTGALIDGQGDEVTARAVTINKPAADLYKYWRDFSNLPSFMDNVVSITSNGDRSHWVVKAPGGKTVEWDARITEDLPNERLAWTSEDGADVANSGLIEFREAGARGTVVTATIAYDPPAGIVGKVIAKMFQREPAIQARRDLRRFKQLMETGEIATSSWTTKQLEEEKA